MHRHEWLTRELMSLSWYAHYLLEALSDGSLNTGGKSQAVAAAKYLVEWEDLIPDTDPLFGYVDDLFVILFGMSELMKLGGRDAMMKYGAKMLPGNITLETKIKEAKAEFPTFWTYMTKEVGGGFHEIQRSIRKDEAQVPQLKTMLQNFIQAAGQRPVNPVDAAALEQFLRTKSQKSSARVPRR